MSDIYIDCYNGAYGPTIRIDVRSPSSLKRLSEVFERMMMNAKSVQLLNELSITSETLTRLTLNCAKGTPKALHSRSKGEFDWSIPSDELANLVRLMDGLRNFGSGHQYLTKEGIDDALIVVSYKEARGAHDA